MIRKICSVVALVVVLIVLAAIGVPYIRASLQVQELWRAYDSTGGEFSFVADCIEQGYSYLEHKENLLGFDWSTVRRAYAERYGAAEGEEERSYLIDEMLALFDDGHTMFIHDPLTLDKSIGLLLEKRAHGVVIASLSSTLASLYPELEPGLLVQHIDGGDIGKMWAKLLAVSGMSLLEKGDAILSQRFFQTYFFYEARFMENPHSVTLGIVTRQGTTQDIALTWQGAAQVKTTHGIQTKARSPKVGASGMMLDEEIGYIKLDSFSTSVTSAKIDSAFSQVSAAKALIIDLRGNGGGSFSKYGVEVLRHILSGSTMVGTKELRLSRFLQLFGDNSGELGKEGGSSGYSRPFEIVASLKNAGTHAGKPVTLLVDETCFSSADMFIAAFADLGLGDIVGRLNALHSGQPLTIEFPDGSTSLQFSTIISRGPSGEITEGRAVSIVDVPLTRDEILGTRDPILETALARIANRLSH